MNRRKIKYSSLHFMQAGCHVALCPPPPRLLVAPPPTLPAAPQPIQSLIVPAHPLSFPPSSPVRLPPLVQPPAVCGIASCCARRRLLSTLRPPPLIAPPASSSGRSPPSRASGLASGPIASRCTGPSHLPMPLRTLAGPLPPLLCPLLVCLSSALAGRRAASPCDWHLSHRLPAPL
jgi:hypothetical protein